MNISNNDVVGEVVARDYRTASIFKSRGIDFCCKGNRRIADVCEKEHIDPQALVKELNSVVSNKETPTTDFSSWDMDLLVDYIEKKHHRYVEQKIPEIKSYLQKVVKVHGERHPELKEINNLFTESAEQLLSHMKKEETILFPHIRNMMGEVPFNKPSFGVVQNPISMMMHEHDTEGNRFRKISSLSNQYTPPQDACTTYRVVFALLKEFEEDLHLHIHLENNILFVKAIEAEQKLNANEQLKEIHLFD